MADQKLKNLYRIVRESPNNYLLIEPNGEEMLHFFHGRLAAIRKLVSLANQALKDGSK